MRRYSAMKESLGYSWKLSLDTDLEPQRDKWAMSNATVLIKDLGRVSISMFLFCTLSA